MHAPECTLFTRTERSPRGGVAVAKRPEYERKSDPPHPPGLNVFRLNVWECARSELRARGAAEIEKLDDDHRGILHTAGKSSGRDRTLLRRCRGSHEV